MRVKCIFGLVALFAWVGLASARAQDDDEFDVPYVPTPENVVETMLKMANLKPGDVLYDLGSGDGRIVIAAAKKYGVRGVGIDINPVRIQEANENARKAGVTDKVEFRKNDLFKEDIHTATVVTIYLLPLINERLKPKLFKELKPGTRIISHDFDMGDWKPEKRVEVDKSPGVLLDDSGEGGGEVEVWRREEPSTKGAAVTTAFPAPPDRPVRKCLDTCRCRTV